MKSFVNSSTNAMYDIVGLYTNNQTLIVSVADTVGFTAGSVLNLIGD